MASLTALGNRGRNIQKAFLGLGGSGVRAIDRLLTALAPGHKFIAAAADQQSLETSLAPVKILLGPNTAQGYGCAGNPMIGRLCAEESLPDILTALEGADTVTLLAGLGGGCGAGAILTVVKALWRLDNPPTVNAVVTRPWPFETGEMDLTAEVLADLPDFCQEVTVIDPGRASGSNLKTPLFRAKELGLAKLVQASVAETR